MAENRCRRYIVRGQKEQLERYLIAGEALLLVVVCMQSLPSLSISPPHLPPRQNYTHTHTLFVRVRTRRCDILGCRARRFLTVRARGRQLKYVGIRQRCAADPEGLTGRHSKK